MLSKKALNTLIQIQQTLHFPDDTSDELITFLYHNKYIIDLDVMNNEAIITDKGIAYIESAAQNEAERKFAHRTNKAALFMSALSLIISIVAILIEWLGN